MKIQKIHKSIQKIGKARAHPGLAFGTNFAGGMAILCYIGYRMDRHFETEVLWTVTASVLGLIYGGYELWKVIRWIQNREDQGLDQNEDI